MFSCRFDSDRPIEEFDCEASLFPFPTTCKLRNSANSALFAVTVERLKLAQPSYNFVRLLLQGRTVKHESWTERLALVRNIAIIS